ncbi:hypothetical protein ACFO3O_06355 [Dokdonia ponticola]|uniref:Uncharacterized protein n=1 Tax=Dokdonia ponticola TaxID=2041041 RepID=A0ABV9HVG5_9FLAO
MTDIEKIQALDMTKILNKEVKSEIEKLIDDYNTAEDKEDFIAVTKESSSLILALITDVYPDAIAMQEEKPCVEIVVTPEKGTKQKIETPKKRVAAKNTSESSKVKKDSPIKKKTKSTSVQSKLQALQEEVEECRKRGATRKSTKKKTPSIPKTVYEKLYSHINAIANLLPEPFRDDPEKISDLKKMSLAIHKKVVVVFELNETLAEKGKLDLKQKFKDITKRIQTNDSK